MGMPTRKRVTRKSVSAEPMMEERYSPPAPRSQPSNLLILLLIGVSFLAGYLFFKVQSLEKGQAAGTTQPGSQQAQQPQRPTELKIKKPDTNEHWRGDANARYVWVEYSDYECPFCKTIHPNMVKLMSENSGKTAWVYRHYPLPFHQNAQKEAEASECIADQGGNDGFWKFTDAIFDKTTSNGTGFALTGLGPLAAELGYDQAKFQDCLDSNKYEKKVKDQLNEGSKAGVQATPTGVVYDIKTGKTLLVEGAIPYDQLKSQLETFMSQNK